MLQNYHLSVTPLKLEMSYQHDRAFVDAPADAAQIAAFRVRGTYASTTFFDVIVPRDMVLTTMQLVPPVLKMVGPLIDQAEVDRQKREAAELAAQEQAEDLS